MRRHTRGLLIDPVVIAFAFLAWHSMRVRQPLPCVAWLTAAWAVAFGMIMTASHSWPGFLTVVFTQDRPGHQDTLSILNGIGDIPA